MSIIAALKARIPQGAKRMLRRFSASTRLSRQISPFLPPVTCIDVGASYYPHGRWKLFLESPSVDWIAVEPNVANTGYVQTWPFPSKVSVVPTGLSRDGGLQTLFVTNVDSGSSLLKPHIAGGMSRRVVNRDYFFPYREVPIETLRLAEVARRAVDPSAPIFVKLDTQGTELSIINGSEELLATRHILGVELEATLLAEPIMSGADRLWEACRYFEDKGFELIDLEPIFGPTRYPRAPMAGKTYLNECNAVFALRPDVAASLPVAQRVALIAFYATNGFFEEAWSAIESDSEAAELLRAAGASLPAIKSALVAMR